jgi:hypothetical protein
MIYGCFTDMEFASDIEHLSPSSVSLSNQCFLAPSLHCRIFLLRKASVPTALPEAYRKTMIRELL